MNYRTISVQTFYGNVLKQNGLKTFPHIHGETFKWAFFCHQIATRVHFGYGNALKSNVFCSNPRKTDGIREETEPRVFPISTKILRAALRNFVDLDISLTAQEGGYNDRSHAEDTIYCI